MAKKDRGKRKGRRDRDLIPPTVPRQHALAVLALAFSGAAVSLYLTYIYHRLEQEPGWSSACAISDTITCDVVLTSSYGALGGVPLSAVGAWFYALTASVAVVALRGNPSRFPRSPGALLVVLSALAVGLSLILALLSALVLRSLCPLCAFLYAANVTLLVISWITFRTTEERLRVALPAEWRHWKTHSVQAAWRGIGALVALIAIVMPWPGFGAPSICAALAAAADTPTGVVSLVIYSDFQCPACKELDNALRPARSNARLRLVHRQYPLDPECNPKMRRARHLGACLQARAAICAGAAGRYVEFSDRLFDEGPAQRSDLLRLARALGLDASRFDACLSSEETEQALKADIHAAILDNVRSTPTLNIDGVGRIDRLTTDDLECLRSAEEGRTRP